MSQGQGAKVLRIRGTCHAHVPTKAICGTATRGASNKDRLDCIVDQRIGDARKMRAGKLSDGRLVHGENLVKFCY